MNTWTSCAGLRCPSIWPRVEIEGRGVFEMLTFWDDTDAIKRFAGDDFSMAKYYDFDSDYLIEKEAGVRHYEVSSQDSKALLPNE